MENSVNQKSYLQPAIDLDAAAQGRRDILGLQQIAGLVMGMGPAALAQVGSMVERQQKAATVANLGATVEGLGATLRRIEVERIEGAVKISGGGPGDPVNEPVFTPAGRRSELLVESARILGSQFQALVRPRLVLSPAQMDILRSFLRTAMYVAEDIRENTAR